MKKYIINTTDELNRIFKDCKNDTVVTIPPGEYYIDMDIDEVFVFEGIRNLSIHAEGVTLYFRGITKPIIFRDCEKLEVTGLKLDYFELPYTHGVIGENDGKSFVVTLLEDNADRIKDIQAFTEYDQDTLAPRVCGNDIYWDCRNVEKVDETNIRVEFGNRHQLSPEGTLVVLRHIIYGYDGITLLNCRSIRLSGVSIYCATGMGVCGYNSENLYFSGMHIAPPKDSKRLMSTTGDGIHLMNCTGEVVVEDSYFAYLGDDSFNSHGMFLKVFEKDGCLLKARHPKGYNLLPEPGDIMEHTRAGVMTAYGSSIVKTVSLEEDYVLLEIVNGEGKEVETGDYLANATRNIKLLYRNNRVENKRCRGILVQTRNAIIDNNVFTNVAGGAILVYTEDFGFWESIGTRDILITNNEMLCNNHAVGRCQADISVVSYTEGYKLGGKGVHKGISICNNSIRKTPGNGIYIACAEDIVIENNYIECRESGIKIERSSNIEMITNEIVTHKDYYEITHDCHDIRIRGFTCHQNKLD